MKSSAEKENELLEQELQSKLAAYLVKTPDSTETKQLINQLQVHFNELQMSVGASALEERKQDSHQVCPAKVQTTAPSMFNLCRNQLRRLPWSFWVLSIALFALITLASSVSTFYSFGYGTLDLLLRKVVVKELNPVLVPLYLFIGIGYSYRSPNPGMRDIEQITPYPPALLLMSRILLMFGLSLILGLLGFVYYWGIDYYHFQSYFVYNMVGDLLNWLTPLCLSAGLMAYLLFRYRMRTAVTGAIIGYALVRLGWMIFINISSSAVLSTLQESLPAILYGGIGITAGLALLILAYRRTLRLAIAPNV